MNEDCSKQSCPVPNNQVQDYLNEYSLNGVVVKSAALSVIIRGVPTNIPEGQFQFPVNINTQSPLTFQGCQGLISIPIPAGSSAAEIQALAQDMVNQAAAQQAQCNAAQSGGIPSVPSFRNQQITISTCGDNSPFLIVDPLFLSGNSLLTTDYRSVTCPAGIFSSEISQADADNRAGQFTKNLVAKMILTGQQAFCCLSVTSKNFSLTGLLLTDPCHAAAQAQAFQLEVPSGRCAVVFAVASDIANCGLGKGCQPYVTAHDFSDACYGGNGCAGPGVAIFITDAGVYSAYVSRCDNAGGGNYSLLWGIVFGNTVTSYTCPGGAVISLGANSFFSSSVAGANALAIAYAKTQC